MSDLDTLNKRLLVVLGLSAETAEIIMDRITKLEDENARLKASKKGNERLEKLLNDAATSLCTISQQAGRTEELREISQIRGYAFSRYSAAIETTEGRP